MARNRQFNPRKNIAIQSPLVPKTRLQTASTRKASHTSLTSRSREPRRTRNALIGLASFGALALAQSAMASECPIEIGQQTPSQSPADAFSDLSKLDMQKGEFETTDAFNRRGEDAVTNMTTPLTVQSKFDPNAAQFDADRNMLRLFLYGWDNAATGWDEVFTRSNTPDNVQYSIYGSDSYLGVGLGQTEEVTDAYEATNSYGASTTVSRVTRNVYSVFSKKIDGENEWQFDGTADYVGARFTLENTGYVDIPMSINQARNDKDRLQVVVSYSPKLPFVAEGSRNWSPTIRRPQNVTAHYNVTIGTIHCVGILDPEGTALHVIYSRP